MVERPEPEFDTDERSTLTQFLRYYRETMALKIDGLSDADARRTTCPPSDLSLLGLIRHLADVERTWTHRRFQHLDSPPLFYGDAHPTGDPDGDLHPGPEDTVVDAVTAWRTEIANTDKMIAAHSLADVSTFPDGQQFSIRWLLVHLIEEYARHAGHADLLRQATDGAVGD